MCCRIVNINQNSAAWKSVAGYLVEIVIDEMLAGYRVNNVFYPSPRVAHIRGRLVALVGLAIEPVAIRIGDARRVASFGVAGMNPIVVVDGAVESTSVVNLSRQAAVVSTGQYKVALNAAAVPNLAWLAVEEVLKYERRGGGTH